MTTGTEVPQEQAQETLELEDVAPDVWDAWARGELTEEEAIEILDK